MNESVQLTYHPLTPDRWGDFEGLFGAKGGYGGCWCANWRIPRKLQKPGETNRQSMRQQVLAGMVPGLMGYDGTAPAAWCSVGPRTEFAALESSRRLKRVDDVPVWSIVCFFVAKPYRNRGVMEQSLRAALVYAKAGGAQVVEAYPVEAQEKLSGYGGFMGFLTALERAGFRRVAKVSETQYIVRCTV